ncbi:extracellular solute-binding protein [Streptomyces sp. NPDC001508]|uniref:extracellular solute-binding protein n=1 Tax=Streptomyces sp. NPDC001508 TaxID=3154656 RepID=UPI00331F14E3
MQAGRRRLCPRLSVVHAVPFGPNHRRRSTAGERVKRINQTIALFEKKSPKIRVKTDFQTYQSFWEKFQKQAVGGNPPDVFQNAVGFLRTYDNRGVLLDLKSQAPAGNLSPDHFRADVTKPGEMDGKPEPGRSGGDFVTGPATLSRAARRAGSPPTTPPCTAPPRSRNQRCRATGCPDGGGGGAPSHGRRRSYRGVWPTPPRPA